MSAILTDVSGQRERSMSRARGLWRLALSLLVLLAVTAGAADRMSTRAQALGLPIDAVGGLRAGPLFAEGGVAWAQANANGDLALKLKPANAASVLLGRFPAPRPVQRYQTMRLSGSPAALALVRSTEEPPADPRDEIPRLVSTEVTWPTPPRPVITTSSPSSR
jgi:hypothetical protein